MVRKVYNLEQIFGGGGGASFDPTTLGAHMLNWVKVDTGTIKTGGGAVLAGDGDFVETCADQGPQAKPTGQFGNPPVYHTTGFNGHPSVNFDGTMKIGTAAAVSPTISVNSPIASFFAAIDITGAGTSLIQVIGAASDGYNSDTSFSIGAGSATNLIYAYTNGGYIAQDVACTWNAYHTIGVVCDGTLATFYVDGVSLGTKAHTGNIGATTATINMGFDQYSNFGVFKFAEFIFTDTVLDAAAVHTYMKNRLGY